MADIATLTVHYRSEGYDKVSGEVDSLTAAGARVEGSFDKIGASSKKVGTASAEVGKLATAAKGVEAPISASAAQLLKWVQRLEAANQSAMRMQQQLLALNSAFGELSGAEQAAAVSATRLADAYARSGAMLQQQLTPLSQYRQRMADIATMQQLGKRSEIELMTARANATAELRESLGLTRTMASAQGQAAAALKQYQFALSKGAITQGEFNGLVEASRKSLLGEATSAEKAALAVKRLAVAQAEANRISAARISQTVGGLAGSGNLRSADLARMRADAMAVWPAFERSGTRAIGHIEARISGLRSAVNGLVGVFKHALGGLIAFAAVGGMTRFIGSIGEANLEMQRIINTLNAATGSVAQANKEFEFLGQLASRIGTDLSASADAYARLAVSAEAAGISTNQLHTSFIGLSEGFAATGRSGDEMNRFLVQLEQGLSQGTLHMRDLRSMAQSFPAAFELAGEAARRMGGSLEGFLKSGGLPAKQFFIVFSDLLHERFARAAEAAGDTFVGAMNKIKNTLFVMKNQGDFANTAAAALNRLNEVLNSSSGREAFGNFMKSLSAGFARLIDLVTLLVKHIGLLTTAVKLLVVVMGGKFLASIASKAWAVGAGLIYNYRNAVTSLAAAGEIGAVSMTRMAFAARALNVALGLIGGVVGLVALAAYGLYRAISNVIEKDEKRIQQLKDKQKALKENADAAQEVIAKYANLSLLTVTKLPDLETTFNSWESAAAAAAEGSDDLAAAHRRLDESTRAMAAAQALMASAVGAGSDRMNRAQRAYQDASDMYKEAKDRLEALTGEYGRNADAANALAGYVSANLDPALRGVVETINTLSGGAMSGFLTKAATSLQQFGESVGLLSNPLTALKDAENETATASEAAARAMKKQATSHVDAVNEAYKHRVAAIELNKATFDLNGSYQAQLLLAKSQYEQDLKNAQSADALAASKKRVTKSVDEYAKLLEQSTSRTQGYQDELDGVTSAEATFRDETLATVDAYNRKIISLEQLIELQKQHTKELELSIKVEAMKRAEPDDGGMGDFARENMASADYAAQAATMSRSSEIIAQNIDKMRKKWMALSDSQKATAGSLDSYLKLAEEAGRKMAAADLVKQFTITSPILDAVDGIKTMQSELQRLQEELKNTTDESVKAYDTERVKELQAAIKAAEATLTIDMIGSYKALLGASQAFTKQGSSGFKNIEKAIAELSIVQDIIAMKAAVIAVLTQGEGEPYSAWARMAAMAAAVAPFLASIGASLSAFGGGGGGGKPSAQSAEVRQALQGTGSVLGDAEAKSESIANATEITANATQQLVGINRGMLTALQSLQQALGAAGGMLARGSGDVEFTQRIGDAGNWNWLFGGDSKLIDQGIIIAGGRLNDMLNSIVVGAYQTVEVSGGWFHSDKTNDEIVDVSDEFGRQFQLVIGSIIDTVREGAKALGLLPADIEAAIAAFQIEETRISLEGLSGEDQQKAIEAVFSKIFDGLAGAVVPWIAQFQKVGEGLGETLIRVATEVQVTQEAFRQLGRAVNETDPEKFAQIADGLSEMMGGIDKFIQGLNSFISNFASDSQKFDVASDALTSAFDQVGLTVPATRDGMWDLMQTLDDTTESGREQIATLLRLADVSGQYYDMLEKATADMVRQIEKAYDTLSGFGVGVGAGGNNLRAISQAAIDAVNAANLLAKAAGQQGAAEWQLALIHRVAAARAAEAIAQLVQATQELVNQFYGNDLTGTVESTSEAVHGFGNAMSTAAQQASDAIRLLLGDLSPLNDQAKLQIALQALSRGEVGREDVLEIGRRLYASSQAYNDLFKRVMAMRVPGTGTGNSGSGGAILGEAAAAQSTPEQAQSTPEQRARERIDLAMQIGQNVATIANAQGEDFSTVADMLGLNLDDIAKALDMSNDDLNSWLQNLVDQENRTPDSIADGADRIIAAMYDIAGKPLPGQEGPGGMRGPPPRNIERGRPVSEETAQRTNRLLGRVLDAVREGDTNVVGAVREVAGATRDISGTLRDEGDRMEIVTGRRGRSAAR